MDVQELQQRVLAARERRIKLDDVTYVVRLPTKHETLVASYRAGLNGGGDDVAAAVVMQRALLERAVVGWMGLRTRDIVAGLDDDAGSEPLGFDAALVPYVLDERPQDERRLAARLVQEINERTKLTEAASGN